MTGWSERRVLVTGAGGFIGSHLTERLVSLGARARALVHYNSSNSWGHLENSPVKEEIQVVAGDLRDRDSINQAFSGIEIVFHLAALVPIPYSYLAPMSYVQTNVGGTLNVLQAAESAGVRLVVHTSTSEVYGTAKYVPIDEEHPIQAQSPYAASKVGADQMAQAYMESTGLKVATIRPFNTYGPRQSTRAVIPTIITQALSDGGVRLGNLAPTRDFSFVSDTVDGFIKIADSPAAVGEVINIAAGTEVSIGDLAESILRLTDSREMVVQDPQRVRPQGSEVLRLWADNGKAQRLVDWKPQISLEDGLSHTIEWVRSNLGQYKIGTYTI